MNPGSYPTLKQATQATRDNIIDNMSNRASKYEQLYKSLKKHFKLQPEPGERSVLEHLLYACCLEDSKAEQADEAFAKLQQAYFDWNEVRVTTVIELGEALGSLPNPIQAGHRIKRCLQSLFEARYQYDIDDLKKANLSKATEEMSAWKGISPFVLNYVSQNALGGHAIPADTFTIEVMVDCEIITQAEAEKKILPGVERAIPKTKGAEFASLLHQFATEFHQHPKNAAVLAVFNELGVTQKVRAVEKPPKKEIKTEVVGKSAVSKLVQAPKARSVAPIDNSTKIAKKTESTATKKSDKAVFAKPIKAKESSSKADTKSDKAPIPKKTADSQVETKPDTKGPVNKSEIKKTQAKPAPKKGEIAPSKKPVAKPPVKEAAKTPVTPTKAPNKASENKKTTPAKKADMPTASASKQAPGTNTAKKKPR